jgi:hypothetical protein
MEKATLLVSSSYPANVLADFCLGLLNSPRRARGIILIATKSNPLLERCHLPSPRTRIDFVVAVHLTSGCS